MTVKWYADQVYRATRNVIEQQTAEAAKNIERDAKKNTPIGQWERDVPSGGPSWLARKPGTARDSVRALKSKYKDGGWIVMAGGEVNGYDAYYYKWIELGAPARNLPQRRPLRRALKKEQRRYRRELKKLLT